MTPRSPLRVIAASAEALVADGEVTDLMAALVDGAVEAMGAAAVGAVALLDNGDLEVLAASSHRAAELELYQAQRRSGPCIEAISTGAVIAAADPHEIESRWPDVAPLVRAAGFSSVHAFPLRWHEHVLGALNVFHEADSPRLDDLPSLGQVYADLMSSLLLRPVRLTQDVVHERVGAALTGRILIEQAKGVVAYTENVDMDVAFQRLRELARRQDRSLTSLAQHILEQKGTHLG